MKDVYRIPDVNYTRLAERLDKLARRAVKLGTAPITYKVVGEEVEERKNPVTAYTYKQTFYLVEVEGEEPRIGGWKFVATLQHLSDEQGENINVVRAVVGETVPTEFRNVDYTRCDHCGQRRYRIDTYLLQNVETGEYKVVGSSCIVDFFGHGDPKTIASYAEYLRDVEDLCRSAEDWGFDGIAGKRNDYLDEYLCFVAEAIIRYGWLSKRRADELGKWEQATALVAETHYGAARDGKTHDTWGNAYWKPSDAAKKLAKEALEWVREWLASKDELSLNDYLYNVSVVVRLSKIERRLFGIAASIIPLYQRETEKVVRNGQKRRVSKHVGTVGKRDTFELTCKHTHEINGYYGATYFHVFEDAEGNVFVWYSSSEWLDEGKTYRIKGTVKEHEYYEGIAQTKLTRCKVLEEIGDAA